MIPAVDVYLSSFGGGTADEVLVGRCRCSVRHGTLSMLFTYDDAYLSDSRAFAIDPCLPLDSAAHHVGGLPGALRDSSPDRWGRHLIARRQRAAMGSGPLRTLDEMDYLLGVHDQTREGALRYRDPASGIFLSSLGEVPPMVELKRVLFASTEVAKGEESIDQVKELLDAGSGSLGGARPKASVLDESKLLLAKFPHPGDEWDVMAWEKTAIDLARAAGIPVPAAHMVRLGRQGVLVIERFDRLGSRIGGVRVPYLSGMTVVRAQDGEQRDYAELAEATAVLVAEPERELEGLFRRVVLSIALHNTDDHLRNIGYLRGVGGWRLAPLFDVNPSPELSRARVTSIFGENGADETSGLLDFAAVCGVSRVAARRIVAEVLGAMRSWREAARRNGCRDAELALFEPVFRDRCHALEDCASSW